MKESDSETHAWLKFLDISEAAEVQMRQILKFCLDKNSNPFFIGYPETFLHPKTQVELGDLAILVNRNRDSVWMTNSEHMLLRLLRRVRETAEGNIFEHPLMGKIKLTKEQLKIIHMPQDVDLKLDEEGDFIENWPEGFFDERVKELF